MVRHILFISIILSVSPVPLTAGPEHLAGFSEEELRRLEDGEIIMTVEPEANDPGRRIHAVFLIERPIEQCWELLRLPERQYEFTARLEESTLLSESADNKVVRFLFKALFLKVRYQINHIFNDGMYQLDLALDPDFENDMAFFEGRWRLYPVEEGLTLARYSSVIRLSPLIPPFVQRILARQSIPSAMEEWKLWIESDGRWRKR